MKRLIALLLAVMMLPIFTLVSHAAGAMTKQDFKEVLLGLFYEPDPDVDYQADLIRAYRNISKDQLDALKAYYNADTTAAVTPMASAAPVITEDEANILTYGFIKLMTFPSAKNGTVEAPNTADNDIGDADIERAADAFFTDFTFGARTDTANNVLNKVAGGKMTKHALGAFVIDLQKNLRAIAGQDETTLANFIAAFVTPHDATPDYIDKIIPYVKTAAARALTNPAGAELAEAKEAMLANGMLMEDLSGNISEDSAFIKLIIHAINTLKNDTANNGEEVISVVMNTVMSGVMDAKVEVYGDSLGTDLKSPVNDPIQPNNDVAELQIGQSVYLKVISDSLVKLTQRGEEASLNFVPSLSPSLNAAVVDENDNLKSIATVTRDPDGMLKLTGTAEGTAILKLYRDTNGPSDFTFNDPTRHNDKELFMELNIKVRGGSGPVPSGPSSSRVEAPTITFEVDADKNITVTLETKTPGATIYYTTDGSAPTKGSQKYEGPFNVPDKTTIKTFAVKPGWIDSYVTTDTIDLSAGNVPGLTDEHIAYVHGRDTGNFDADDNVTRAEVTAMFSRLIVKKMVFLDGSESKFSDVNEGDWYTAYVKFLSNAGIVNGYEDGTFGPNKPITRAEFATIASRFFELEEGNENNFPDVADNHWAKDFIDSAAIKGWLVGYEDGTFRPDQPIKRSEAVTIINRMLNRVADKEYIEENIDEVLTYPDLDKSHWAYYEILEASNWHDHKVENNTEFWTDIFYEERFLAS